MKIDADLKPMDVLISRKWEERWWPPSAIGTQIFQGCVYMYGKRLYKKQLPLIKSTVIDFLKSTHARLNIDGKIGFDFNWPKARYFDWEHWMSDPEYGTFFRHKRFGGQVTSDEVYDACLPFEGKIYDVGDLLDTMFGINFFSFGKDNYFCSAGARRVVEDITGEVQFPEVDVDKTPPCSWAFSDKWSPTALLKDGLAI